MAHLDDAAPQPRVRLWRGLLLTAGCVAIAHSSLVLILAPLHAFEYLLMLPCICFFGDVLVGSWKELWVMAAGSCCWGVAVACILGYLRRRTGLHKLTGRARLAARALGMLALGVLCLGLVRYYQYGRQAEAILHQAQRDAGASPAYKDANLWLEQHGFYVLRSRYEEWSGDQTITVGPDVGRYYIVVGLKRLGSGSLFIGDRWIELMFRFTLDHKFRDVKLDKRYAPTKWQLRQLREVQEEHPAAAQKLREWQAILKMDKEPPQRNAQRRNIEPEPTTAS